MAALTASVSSTGWLALRRFIVAAKPRTDGTRLGFCPVADTRSSHGVTDRSVATAITSSTLDRKASSMSLGVALMSAAVWPMGVGSTAGVGGTAGLKVGVGAAVGATVGTGVGATVGPLQANAARATIAATR